MSESTPDIPVVVTNGHFTSPLMVVQAAIAGIPELVQRHTNQGENLKHLTRQDLTALIKQLAAGSEEAGRYLAGALDTIRNYELSYGQLAKENQLLRAELSGSAILKPVLRKLHYECLLNGLYNGALLPLDRQEMVEEALNGRSCDGYNAFLDNFLAYGTGGATPIEAQYIDQIRTQEERAESAEQRVCELLAESEQLTKAIETLKASTELVRAEALASTGELAIARSREAAAVSEAGMAKDALSYRDALIADALRGEPETEQAGTNFERIMRCLSRYRVLYAKVRERLFTSSEDLRQVVGVEQAHRQGAEAAVAGLTQEANPYTGPQASARAMVAWSQGFVNQRQLEQAIALSSSTALIMQYLGVLDPLMLPDAIEAHFAQVPA